MKSLLLIGVLGFFSSNVFASFPVDCQMEMLKIANDSYKNNAPLFHYVFDISKVEFFSLSSKKQDIVRFSSAGSPSGQTCNLDVILSYSDDNVLGCPVYKLESLSTPCN